MKFHRFNVAFCFSLSTNFRSWSGEQQNTKRKSEIKRQVLSWKFSSSPSPSEPSEVDWLAFESLKVSPHHVKCHFEHIESIVRLINRFLVPPFPSTRGLCSSSLMFSACIDTKKHFAAHTQSSAGDRVSSLEAEGNERLVGDRNGSNNWQPSQHWKQFAISFCDAFFSWPKIYDFNLSDHSTSSRHESGFGHFDPNPESAGKNGYDEWFTWSFRHALSLWAQLRWLARSTCRSARPLMFAFQLLRRPDAAFVCENIFN